MKLHRFYVKGTVLEQDLTLNDESLVHQWTKVLRFKIGREVSLFNNEQEEKLYKITYIDRSIVKLAYLSTPQPLVAKNDVYLCFSLLKKDKNDWVFQKGTELGVTHFVPLLCDRTEKTGFDIERALRIVTEAAEQCGRSDIPKIHEPLSPEKSIEALQDKVDLFVAEQTSEQDSKFFIQNSKTPIGVLIGAEGGWTDKEKQLFVDKKVRFLSLSDFTLRAETAAVAAAALLAKGVQ